MDTLELDIKTIRHKDKPLSFTVQVVKQQYRGTRAWYTTVKGFIFASVVGCPALRSYNKSDYSPTTPMMHLRGSGHRNDNVILTTESIGYIERLKEAVIEYNEHFKRE